MGVFLKCTLYAQWRGAYFMACNLQDKQKTRDMSTTGWIIYNEQKLICLMSLVAKKAKMEMSVLL